jgi:hypothetical protein
MYPTCYYRETGSYLHKRDRPGTTMFVHLEGQIGNEQVCCLNCKSDQDPLQIKRCSTLIRCKSTHINIIVYTWIPESQRQLIKSG